MDGKKKKPGLRRKHIPQRTCVVCRTKMDKRDLVRIVNTPDEGVVFDPTGKRNGRGAYVGRWPECWEKALQGKRLDSALRTTVSAEEKARLADISHALQNGSLKNGEQCPYLHPQE